MTQINPFIGSVLQSTSVQRAQAAEKDRHVQRARDRAKDSALAGDRFQHQVESSEVLTPIHDQNPEHPRQRKRHPNAKKPAALPCGTTDDDHDEQAHIDVKV